MLARLVTRRARRGTCARRTEYLDSIRTRRRTDAHTRSISFSRAHMTVHDDNSITPKRSPRMSLRTQACLESFNPQVPNDMGLRRCGVRTKRTRLVNKNKHGFTPGEKTQVRSQGNWKDTIQDTTHKIKFDAFYALPQCQSLRGSLPPPDIGGPLWRRACFFDEQFSLFC